MLQQPEPEQHQRQQDKVGLSEIEHVEHKGDGDEARQREQPRTRRAAGARHRVGELRRHPPRQRVEQRQEYIKRQLAEITGDREQHRRGRGG